MIRIMILLLCLLAVCFAAVHGNVNFEVDVVFTWKRQPSEKELHIISSKYCSQKHGHKASRFRETGTLEYAIHAVKSNLPWVRNIFLVTNDERPCWLGNDNPDVTIITHEQIWPLSRIQTDLPTFNSIAIETHLHRIPGLSEYFIYLNDDMFVGKTLSKSYFFDPLGRPLVSLKSTDKVKMESVDRIAAQKAPWYLIGTHGPYIARISTIETIQSIWSDYFNTTSSSRCRTKADTQSKYANHVKPPFWVYNWYGAVTNTSASVVTAVQFMDYHFTPEAFYAKLLQNPPSEMFTLNDDFSLNPVRASGEIFNLVQFLSRYFSPYPNSYGKNFSTCGLQIDRGLVDISRKNLSFYGQSKRSIHALNAVINSTLASVEVGHFDEHRLRNLVNTQGNGLKMLRDTDTIRVTYFNAERGTKWREQCALILKHSSVKKSSILFFNELDVGMARSRNENTAFRMANCLQMNYAYGIEFVELSLGQKKEIQLLPKDKTTLNQRSFHGNAIFSKYPLRNVEVLQLPGTAEYWRKGGKYNEPRLGERMALFASVPVQRKGGGVAWMDLVSTHLDAFVGESYNIKSAQLINAHLNKRNCSAVILAGDLGNRGGSLAQSAAWLHTQAGFLDPLLSNTMKRGYRQPVNPKGDWILCRDTLQHSRNTSSRSNIQLRPIPQSIEVVPTTGLSDHNLVTVTVQLSPQQEEETTNSSSSSSST